VKNRAPLYGSFDLSFSPGAIFNENHSICRADSGSMAAVGDRSDCFQYFFTALFSRVLQNLFGNVYLFNFPLLNHIRYKSALRVRFRVAKFLRNTRADTGFRFEPKLRREILMVWIALCLFIYYVTDDLSSRRVL
jgi:hypothetical protein